MIVDTHAHLDFENYSNNLNDVIKRAFENDVQKIIIPGVRADLWENVLKIANDYENIYAMLGVHPSDVSSWNDSIINKMEDFLINQKKVVGIGEIGLDYYYSKDDKELQIDVFKKQIEVAKKYKKTIVIHSRDAHGDTLNIIKETKAYELCNIVFHCFSGSLEFANECIKLGAYIAIGGVVTFKNAKNVKHVAQNIPLDRLLLETDSPYLTPAPHRGEENEPGYTKFVANEIANLRNISYDEIAKATTHNVKKVFGI